MPFTIVDFRRFDVAKLNLIYDNWYKSMRIVFFGTSNFAVEIFKHLMRCDDVDVAAVVTRPDRAVGRSSSLESPPVKCFVQSFCPHMPVHQPEKASTISFENVLRSYDADLFVVVAYGEILKPHILSLPKWAPINVHASLLPHYRGAAPMQRALMHGEGVVGVTIIEMTDQMDAGDMLGRAELSITDQTTYGDLQSMLPDLAADALIQVMRGFVIGAVFREAQDFQHVTYAPKIRAEEEKILWSKPAREVHNLIRALSPQPGAFCYFDVSGQKKRLKIQSSEVVKFSGDPGKILSFTNKEWIVACGEDSIRILEMQLEGKKKLSLADFVNGCREKPDLLF